eukprot:gene9394-4870_t
MVPFDWWFGTFEDGSKYKGKKYAVPPIHDTSAAAGKGRTGVMVCAYLMATGSYKTAEQALKSFASLRTNDGVGVSIPSQIRYVGYWEQILRDMQGKTPDAKRLRLSKIKVSGGNKPGGSPWELYFKVQ